jgi:hypothetical protein
LLFVTLFCLHFRNNRFINGRVPNFFIDKYSHALAKRNEARDYAQQYHCCRAWNKQSRRCEATTIWIACDIALIIRLACLFGQGFEWVGDLAPPSYTPFPPPPPNSLKALPTFTPNDRRDKRPWPLCGLLFTPSANTLRFDAIVNGRAKGKDRTREDGWGGGGGCWESDQIEDRDVIMCEGLKRRKRKSFPRHGFFLDCCGKRKRSTWRGDAHKISLPPPPQRSASKESTKRTRKKKRKIRCLSPSRAHTNRPTFVRSSKR